jgi:ubiquinone biosynthesis protein COQ4
MADDYVPYFMRGLQDIPTASSRLVSSSKFLNHPVIREYVMQESLRKNGRDFPMTYGLPNLFQALYEIRDAKRINEMLADQCKTKPELAAWFEEGYISTFTRQDLAKYAPNTCGGEYYHYLSSNNFEIVLDPRIEMDPTWKPQSMLDYWDLRTGQTHDLDHLLGGAGFDFLGETTPLFMRIEAYFTYFDDPELAGELCTLLAIMAFPTFMRTMIHYPSTWQGMSRHITNGMKVGRESEPWFLKKFEPIFGMSKKEARDFIGMKGVTDVETYALSDVWSEGAQTAQLELAKAAE